ncbi:bifunctional DNA primase/polymerase [Qipengyuania flava]|uniref:bifunctional DNA primase/polymerase n=1 Tax=Qipengyuania flava TaxID=192812 RepID=UPI0012FE4461
MSTFGEWQPRYEEAGIATFPVRDKKPAVQGYLKAGLRASRQFAGRFAAEEAFGFACKRNNICVLDVDTPSEQTLCDALAKFGPTPIIVRSRWRGARLRRLLLRHTATPRKAAEHGAMLSTLPRHRLTPPDRTRRTPGGSQNGLPRAELLGVR